MANAGVLGILIVAAIIGAAFTSYYVTASPLQSQIVSFQSEISSMSANPSTATIIATPTVATTSISTTTLISTVTSESISITTSTTIYYPIPDNVTVDIAPSGAFLTFVINATYVPYYCHCNYYVSGSLSSEQQVPVSPVYQNELITINIALDCADGTGQTASASLYVNSVLVALTNVACGDNVTGQISYVL